MGAYLDLDDVTRHNPHARAQLDQLIRERDKARAEVERLRELLKQALRHIEDAGDDTLAAIIDTQIGSDTNG